MDQFEPCHRSQQLQQQNKTKLIKLRCRQFVHRRRNIKLKTDPSLHEGNQQMKSQSVQTRKQHSQSQVMTNPRKDVLAQITPIYLSSSHQVGRIRKNLGKINLSKTKSMHFWKSRGEKNEKQVPLQETHYQMVLEQQRLKQLDFECEEQTFQNCS